MSDFVFGKNSVKELLQTDRSINKLFLVKGFKDDELIKLAKSKRLIIKTVDKKKLDSMTGGKNHQGIIASVSPKDYADIEQILQNGEEGRRFIIVLDSLEDPHNLGAILRVADGAKVDGVVIPKNRAVPLTSTVAKVAAGAMETVPVAQVTNLSRSIEELKDKGFWVTGADPKGQPFYKSDLKGNVCLVIGGEGKGITRLVKEKCDFLASIPLSGKVTSLNAATATAILSYEVVRQRANEGS
ncbi:23S rRNA (guanosine(2251)-2'-O)-methyltransferase RlmB [Proteinivorax hydrogeniformans]|uniref:23S rRNA (Guanosine(2251)-2'-O)-methyltransferase RlmB n=1 Tax=Proteinivorax hydrogeniformans TaxID=1826727 RepID=A0AAU8HTU5_9FIRM